jgi:hypothetical protein
MCYSAQDSLNAYFTASLLCGLLVFGVQSPAVRSAALFLWFVAQMQLLDWMFWQTPECGPTNEIATALAIVLNHLQPVIFVAAQALFGIPIRSLSWIILAAYVVLSLPYTLKGLSTVRCTSPEGGLMKWKWNLLPGGEQLYFVFFVSLIASAFNYKSKTFAGMAATLSVLSILAAMKTPRLNASVGRVWCYYAAVSPLALLPWV